MKPWWTAVAFTGLLVACSGGTFPVEVDGPGPGAGESQGPSADGVELPPPVGGTSGNPSSSGNPTSSGGSSSSSASSSSSSSASSSSSGGVCQGCNDYLNGNMVMTPCANTSMVAQNLFGCGCAACSQECMATLCSSVFPVDATCDACLSGSCGAEYTACQNDLGM